MSAIEETDTAGTAGKDTRDGIQPSGATSTHTVVAAFLLQLAYGVAIHAEFAAWELRPERLDTGVSTAEPGGRRELYLRLIWPAESEDLSEDVRPDGLTLAWSHITGWSAHSGDNELVLHANEFAAPSTVAEIALHLVEDGLDCGWQPAPDAVRWEHADLADLACVLFDEGAR